MMKLKKSIPSPLIYCTAFIIIGGWWFGAFFFPKEKVSVHTFTKTFEKPHLLAPSYLHYLSTLDRDKIQQALSGNISLMTQMITEWDVDAKILESHGVHDVRRLPLKTFVKAQKIGRKLRNRGHDVQQDFNFKIFDDNGVEFNLKQQFKKFLPQTYLSATILLALTQPENIVAIPRGFRDDQELFPKALTNKIPLDIDRYNAEEIMQNKPDIAFVAHYSQPSTLQALSNQGIPLFTIKDIDTLPEITQTINKIGQVVHRPLVAQLLTIFMESALLAIDNHLLAMSRDALACHGSPRILFLQHHSRLSLPTQKVISGQLVQRLNEKKFSFVTFKDGSSNEWQIPIEQEQIVNLDPDCLIVATSNGTALKHMFKTTPPFDSLKAVREENIHFIGLTPQAPTQYIILAYYDIAEALVKAVRPFYRWQ